MVPVEKSYPTERLFLNSVTKTIYLPCFPRLFFAMDNNIPRKGLLKWIGVNPIYWEIKHDILGWQASHTKGNSSIAITLEEAEWLVKRQRRFVRSGPIGELP